MSSFSGLIDRIGVPALAGILGLPESHIRTMKARDSIPPEHWRQIVDSGHVSWIDLHSLRASRFAPERHRQASGAAA